MRLSAALATGCRTWTGGRTGGVGGEGAPEQASTRDSALPWGSETGPPAGSCLHHAASWHHRCLPGAPASTPSCPPPLSTPTPAPAPRLPPSQVLDAAGGAARGVAARGGPPAQRLPVPPGPRPAGCRRHQGGAGSQGGAGAAAAAGRQAEGRALTPFARHGWGQAGQLRSALRTLSSAATAVYIHFPLPLSCSQHKYSTILPVDSCTTSLGI